MPSSNSLDSAKLTPVGRFEFKLNYDDREVVIPAEDCGAFYVDEGFRPHGYLTSMIVPASQAAAVLRDLAVFSALLSRDRIPHAISLFERSPASGRLIKYAYFAVGNHPRASVGDGDGCARVVLEMRFVDLPYAFPQERRDTVDQAALNQWTNPAGLEIGDAEKQEILKALSYAGIRLNAGGNQPIK